ncbi:MAG: hypothetical protein HKN57_04655 [Xanthomonadales bacterium]|nr:hypothetical protein [Gammaproteobacteria bacterium]NND56521.1 hypothetical protein [Xanthomonadales bacterium]NNK52580.1 hypothetical protein [Xanthomonadales bacterium]
MKKQILIALTASAFSMPIAQAQQERVITAEELQRFNPRSVQLIKKTDMTAAGATINEERLRGLPIDRSAISGPAITAGRAPASLPEDYRVTPGEYLMIESLEPPLSLDCAGASGSCIQTPIRFLTLTPEGAKLNLALTLASTERFILDQAANRFIGSAHVQLRDTDNPDEVREIGATIRVVVSADVDEIEPGTSLEFGQTNRFQNVRLAALSPENPTVVTLTPERSADPQKIAFSVVKPRLLVELGQERILGLGLETVTVTVRTEGIEALPRESIAVSSESGLLTDNTLRIDHQSGVGSTLLRSRGMGKDTITAKLARFTDGSASIVYATPWSWLIAVLLGIIVGVGIRLAMRAKQQTPRSGVVFNIVIGIIGGLLTAVLYAQGVNVLPLPLPGGFSEALTFVLSALGGWVFPRWLEALGPPISAESN